MTDLPAPLSGRNPRLTTLRRLLGRRSARREAGAFVLEGRTLLTEALAASGRGGCAARAVYLDADAPDAAAIAAQVRAAGVELVLVEPGVVGRVASTSTPQPVLTVATLPETTLEAVLPGALADPGALVLVLVDVGDPGNVGTLLRSARAAGAAAVLACGATADPWSPKTVRASAGAVLGIPVAEHRDANAVLSALAAGGVRRVGTVVDGGAAPEAVDLRGRTALVLGSEAHGLDPALASVLDERITIPMAPGAESLNVAMAGTVVLFEAARQRRIDGRGGRIELDGSAQAGQGLSR